MTSSKAKLDIQNVKSNYINFKSCPKFHTCNAPICPLDNEWHTRKNLSEDATCFYLIESVKHAAKARFEVAGLAMLYENVVGIRGNISARYARINYTLERAKTTGSRMARKVGASHE